MATVMANLVLEIGQYLFLRKSSSYTHIVMLSIHPVLPKTSSPLLSQVTVWLRSIVVWSSTSDYLSERSVSFLLSRFWLTYFALTLDFTIRSIGVILVKLIERYR